jgi:hypothetical protein
MRESRSRRAEYLAVAFFYLAVVNFIVFWAIDSRLGGDAFNGQRTGDRYFLSQGGRLTEVSRGVFRYSQVHIASVLVTFPGAMVAAWYVSRKRSSRTPPKGGTA